jgi:hypothetical protein
MIRWIKDMVHKIADLIPDRFKHQDTKDPAPGVLTELDKQLGRKIQQRQAREKARAVDTRQGGPNMPKYQPCPKGHGLKKREDKAIVGGIPGALYYCNICKDSFFVKVKGV